MARLRPVEAGSTVSSQRGRQQERSHDGARLRPAVRWPPSDLRDLVAARQPRLAGHNIAADSEGHQPDATTKRPRAHGHHVEGSDPQGRLLLGLAHGGCPGRLAGLHGPTREAVPPPPTAPLQPSLTMPTMTP